MKEKRALLCLLAAGLMVNLVACGGSNDNAVDNSQDTSTPAVTQSVESSTPEVTPTPEQTTQTAPETTPTPESVSTPARDDTTEQEQLFTDCSETMYATTTVNVRSSYSTNSDKLGSLTKAQSVTRTGIGTGDAAGWSRIEFNGKVAYVSSDYLSATKPQVNTSTGSSGSSGGQTSKPSTGGSGGGNSQTTTSGSEIDKGSSNTSSGSGGGLSGLAGAIEQGREDHGYSGGVGGQLTDEDREWVGGQIQVGG